MASFARVSACLLVVACGGGGHAAGDAPPPVDAAIDAPVDAPPGPPVPGQIIVRLEERGVGAGRVVSSPSGLDCATMGPDVTRCAAMFDGTVTLTATPSSGYVFAGWNAAGCGTSPTCTVTTAFDPVTVFAYFVPAGYHVVQFTGGTAPAEVWAVASPLPYPKDVDQPTVSALCRAPCMLPVPTGWSVTVAGSTPGTFGGLSGDCTSSTAWCTFTPTADATVHVDAQLDSHERLSIVLPISASTVVTGIDVDSHDHIILGTANSLRKLDAAGTPIWIQPFAGPARVRVSPDDHIVALTATTLSRWTPDGVMEWSHDITTTRLAVAPNGDIVVDDVALTVFDASGAMRWSKPLLGGLAVAVRPDGAIWVADSVSQNLIGWTSDGADLPAIPLVVPEGSDLGLSADAVGFVIDRADYTPENALMTRYKWDGTIVFGDGAPQGGQGGYDAPNAIAADGHVWWSFTAGVNATHVGYFLRSYDATGTVGVAVLRLSTQDTDSAGAYEVQQHDLRLLSDGRAVLVGDFVANSPYIAGDDALDGGFLQIFAP